MQWANLGVLKDILELVLTMKKSKRRRDTHFKPFRMWQLKMCYRDGLIKKTFSKLSIVSKLSILRSNLFHC